ncbi:hypothetical protein XCR1_840064 [Xenorhabdus cabanillasii JM26]|uniref:Uncharacterized protein n=1 Tax=Xenorhabdus cabanillasii JM26 TaxID=1427517 RepID=W1J8Q9_9GAMM|nr:hypothetical protein XCR1_840064 [Xenorhabdus cabanillasii JM26]
MNAKPANRRVFLCCHGSGCCWRFFGVVGDVLGSSAKGVYADDTQRFGSGIAGLEIMEELEHTALHHQRINVFQVD